MVNQHTYKHLGIVNRILPENQEDQVRERLSQYRSSLIVYVCTGLGDNPCRKVTAIRSAKPGQNGISHGLCSECQRETLRKYLIAMEEDGLAS